MTTSTTRTTSNTSSTCSIPSTLTPTSEIPPELISETAANDPSSTDPLHPVRNKILLEDCLVGMDRIPDQSIDMILCDLPYGTTQCKWDAVIPFAPLWMQYERIIKKSGAIVLTAAQPFTSALVMSNPDLFKYAWVWEKNKATGHLNAKKEPLRKHEDVLVFGNGPVRYFPQGTIKGVFNSTRPAKGKQKGEIYGQQRNDYAQSSVGNYPKSVVEFPVPHKPVHPTQKPLELFEYLIRTYTQEGDIVLDSCMGSGTTALACMATGRSFVGFEKDEQYHRIAMSRIAAHSIPASDASAVLAQDVAGLAA